MTHQAVVDKCPQNELTMTHASEFSVSSNSSLVKASFAKGEQNKHLIVVEIAQSMEQLPWNCGLTEEC